MGSIFSPYCSPTKQKDEKNSLLSHDSNPGLLECYLCAMHPPSHHFLEQAPWGTRSRTVYALLWWKRQKGKKEMKKKRSARQESNPWPQDHEARVQPLWCNFGLRWINLLAHLPLTTMSWVRIPVSNTFCHFNLFHVSTFKKNLTLLLCRVNLLGNKLIGLTFVEEVDEI